MITPRSLILSGASPTARTTAMISSMVGGSGGYRWPLFRGIRPLVKGRQGRGRSAPAGAIQQSYRCHDVLLWTTIEPHDPPATRSAECERTTPTASFAKCLLLATRAALTEAYRAVANAIAGVSSAPRRMRSSAGITVRVRMQPREAALDPLSECAYWATTVAWLLCANSGGLAETAE
jgi:hypothetical protein